MDIMEKVIEVVSVKDNWEIINIIGIVEDNSSSFVWVFRVGFNLDIGFCRGKVVGIMMDFMEAEFLLDLVVGVILWLRV